MVVATLPDMKKSSRKKVLSGKDARFTFRVKQRDIARYYAAANAAGFDDLSEFIRRLLDDAVAKLPPSALPKDANVSGLKIADKE